jgi:protein SCO1/2
VAGEDRVQALVAETRAHPRRRRRLVALLREDSVIYRERSRIEVNRMRGWILQAFGEVGLPADALPFVLQELESGHDAYVVAAAARALRGHRSPSRTLIPFVERAMSNLRHQDDRVSFAGYGGYGKPGEGTTALRELGDTLAWLEASAADSGCCAPIGFAPPQEQAGAGCEAAAALPLQDHEGRIATFGALFHGRPSIVAFFYTRCDNPQKCSLTVTKLARVQRLLAEAGLAGRIRTAAITYDPEFDLPERLRVYGEARGMRLDDDHRMLRSTAGLEPLRAAFGLGVGLAGSMVNVHRTELFVLDARARIVCSFARLEWQEEAVVARAKRVLDRASPAGVGRAFVSWLPALAVALFPKCPACFAAYLSVLGVAGVARIAYAPWLLPVLVALVIAGLAASWRLARRRGAMAGFWLTAAGSSAILVLGLGLRVPGAAAAGVVLNAIGAVAGVSHRLQRVT